MSLGSSFDNDTFLLELRVTSSLNWTQCNAVLLRAGEEVSSAQMDQDLLSLLQKDKPDYDALTLKVRFIYHTVFSSFGVLSCKRSFFLRRHEKNGNEVE